jgi:hypothetical protein
MNVNNMWLTSGYVVWQRRQERKCSCRYRALSLVVRQDTAMATRECFTTWSFKTPYLNMQNGGQASFRPTGLAEEKTDVHKGVVFGDMNYSEDLKMAATTQKR